MAFVGFGTFNRANQAAILQQQQQSLLRSVNQFAPAPAGGVFGSPQNLQAMAFLMQALQSVFAAFSSFAGGQVLPGGVNPNQSPVATGSPYGGQTAATVQPGAGGQGGYPMPGGSGGQGGYPMPGGSGGPTGYPMPDNYGGQPAAGGPAPTQAEGTGNQASAARLLSQNFDRIDKNRDGVISGDEINLFRDSRANAPQSTRDALGSLADAVPELMFGTIQSGDAAWFGLSKEDLVSARRQLNSGTSLEEIQRNIQTRVIRERNVPYNGRSQSAAEAFRTYVEQQRTRVLR
jgi:hypothetical protein